MSKRDKGRLPPFVPLLVSSLDSPAWQATSHGAKALYVSLKRRVPNGRNKAYISGRMAQRELKSHRRKVREWFAELEHFGFIELAEPGRLGVDGQGKAPHWRLTELGSTSKTSADGLLEPPSRDFLKWDGTPFDPKPFRLEPGLDRLQKQNPGSDACTRAEPTHVPPLEPTHVPLKSEGGADACSIVAAKGGADACSITSLTTTGESAARSPTLSEPLSEGSKIGKNKNGIFDERVSTLEATTRRLKAERRKAWASIEPVRPEDVRY
jgi:hypothetical protein